METRKTIVAISIVTIAVFALADAALGATVCVPDDYATIQAAINNVNAGDTIKVCEGTYTLTAQIDVNIAVTLEGGYDAATCSTRDLCNNETIIDGDNEVRCFNISAAATIDGFTITDGRDREFNGNGQGIYCSASATVSNCVLVDNSNTGDDGAGMYNYRCSPTIDRCVFFDNEADYGGGMYNYYSSPDVNNCLFYRNDCDEHGAGMCNYESSPTITNCTFVENDSDDYGGAIYNDEDSDAVVCNSIFWDNDADAGRGVAGPPATTGSL
jgi:hypothetical protein